MEKKCLECGEPLIGRSDKKFCDDSCRSTFNNKLNIGDKNLVRNTNNRLKKNYKILCELNTKDKTKVTKKALEDRLFDFKLMTSYITTQKGNVYHFCYNQGYMLLDENWVLLVKNKS